MNGCFGVSPAQRRKVTKMLRLTVFIRVMLSNRLFFVISLLSTLNSITFLKLPSEADVHLI